MTGVRRALVCALVLEALQAIVDEGRPADAVLDRLLRSHRELSSAAERAAVAHRSLGIACLRGRLDFCSLTPNFAVGVPIRIGTGSLPTLGCRSISTPPRRGSRPGSLERRRWMSPHGRPSPRSASPQSARFRGWLARLWHDEFGAASDAVAEP